MQFTKDEKSKLLNEFKIADHLYTYSRLWILAVDSISVIQATTLKEILKLNKHQQKAYIIYKDELYPVPTHVKQYRIKKILKKR